MGIHLFLEDVELFNVGSGVSGPWLFAVGGTVAGGTKPVACTVRPMVDDVVARMSDVPDVAWTADGVARGGDTVGSMVDEVVARMPDVLGVGWAEDGVEDDDTEVRPSGGLRADVKDPFAPVVTVDEAKLEVPEDGSTPVPLTMEVLDMKTVDGVEKTEELRQGSLKTIVCVASRGTDV